MAVKLKGKPLVGLDIGSRAIKAVELSRSPKTERYAMSGYVYREIAPGEDLKEVLKAIWAEHNFHTNKVVTSVSGRSVIVRYITMPEMTDEELKNAIKYEASKYIPFEVDEVMLDCMRLPHIKKDEGSGKPGKDMTVLLVAAKRDKLDEHITLLEQGGLWPMAVDVDCFALGNSFELKQLINPSADIGNKVNALIDIGGAKTNVNIMLGLQVFFTREIYIAGNDFTETISKKMGLPENEAEQLKRNPQLKADEIKDYVSSLLDDLTHEIQLSFDYFEHQFDKPIENIYLSGGASLLQGLEESFDSTFNRKLIRWDPCESFEVVADKIDPVDLKKKASQLVIAS
ncbi:MAG: type IV pilus assembly protein PilM, partial [Planctomycetota bacterium]